MKVSQFAGSVRAALDSLDVERANHLYSSEEIGLLKPSHPLCPHHTNILRSALRIGRPLVEGGGGTIGEWTRQDKVDVIFFAHTQNQFDALREAYNRCGASKSFITTQAVTRLDGIEAIRFPTRIAAFLSLIFLPKVSKRAIQAEGYRKTSYKAAFDSYLLSYGVFVVWYITLQEIAPKVIVSASDHDIHAGALLSATNRLGSKLIYVQHASVTDRFPPLAMDYAFLEGEDAYQKYLRAGPVTAQIYLTGMPKSDMLRGDEEEIVHDDLMVGICLNALDHVEEIEALIKVVSEDSTDYHLVVRPHPRTPVGQKRRLSAFVLSRGGSFSDPEDEPVFRFLQTVDVLVAGESSIHLEAALSGVEPIYYDPSGIRKDVYGYLQQGLIQYESHEPQDVVSTLSAWRLNPSALQSRVKFYVDVVGTPYSGRSSNLVAELIEEIAANDEIDRARWDMVDSTGQAFRLLV